VRASGAGSPIVGYPEAAISAAPTPASAAFVITHGARYRPVGRPVAADGKSRQLLGFASGEARIDAMLPSVTAEQDVDVEVARARDAYRRGVPPSQIVDALLRRGWGTIMVILLGRRAFDLTIGECKMADGWSSRGIDAPIFDAYFVPLIERKRAIWDR
jgi:hypothetical protein